MFKTKINRRLVGQKLEIPIFHLSCLNYLVAVIFGWNVLPFLSQIFIWKLVSAWSQPQISQILFFFTHALPNALTCAHTHTNTLYLYESLERDKDKNIPSFWWTILQYFTDECDGYSIMLKTVDPRFEVGGFISQSRTCQMIKWHRRIRRWGWSLFS